MRKSEADSSVAALDGGLQRLITSQLPALIWVLDRDLRVTSLEGRVPVGTGLTRDTVLGRDVREIVDPALHGLLADVLQGRGTKLRLVRGEVPFDHTLEPLRDAQGCIVGIIGMSIDVSEQVAAERRVAESEALFRTTFEQAAVGMALCDLSGRYLRVNAEFCRITGYTAEELYALDAATITHPEDLPKDLEWVRRVMAGEVPQYSRDKRYVRKDGSTVWVSLSVTVRREDGRPIQLLGVAQDISSRVRTVQALEAERAFAGAVFDGTGAYLMVMDAQGRILQCNDACLAALGYEVEEMLGRTPWELFVAHPEEQADVAARYAELPGLLCEEAARRFPMHTERTWRTRRGDLRCIALTTTYQPAPDGKVGSVIVSGIDVTERRAAERRLSQTNDLLEQVFRQVHGSFALLDRDLRFVRVNEQYAKGAGLPVQDLLGRKHFDLFPSEEAEAIFRRVRDTGEPYEVTARPFENPQTPGVGTTWWNWSLTALADATGRTGHLLLSLHEVTEFKRAEQRLAENERRLEEAQRIAHMGSWTWEIASGGLTWSDEIFRIFGYEPDAVTPTYERFVASVHEADRQKVRDAVQAALAGTCPYRVEHRVVRPDGTVRHVLEQGEVHRDEGGEAIRVVGTVLDVTEREVALRALEGERNFSTAVFDSTPALVVVHDRDGRIVRFNRAAADVAGYAPEEVIGRRTWEVLPATEEMRAGVKARFALMGQLTPAGALERFGATVERLWRTKDGRVRRISWSLAYLPDEHGKVAYQLASGLDITESRAAEEALLDSEARYERAVRGSNDGIWDWNIETGDAYLSPRCLEMLGYAPDELGRGLEGFLALVHPEDLECAQQAVQRHLETGEAFDSEFRMRCRDGDYLWVRSRGRAQRDDQGRPLRMAGSLTDITDARAAEAEIRQLNETLEQRVRERTAELAGERNFTNTVLDTQEALVVVLDREGRIVRFNRACEVLTGYAQSEALGRKVWDFLIPPAHAQSVAGVFAQLTAGDFPNQHENPWLDREGRSVLIAWRNSAIVDDAGQVQYVIATGIDVTQQRAAEQALRMQAQVINQASAAVATTDLSGRVTSWNRHAETYLGYSAQEAHCQHIGFVYPAGMPFAKLAQEALDARGEATVEQVMRTKSGEERPVLLTLAYLRDPLGEPVGMVGFAVDITELKAAEVALAAARARLAFLLTSGPAMIYAATPDGAFRTTFLSENAREALGYAPEQFTADPGFWMERVHEEDRPRVRAGHEALQQNGRYAHEYRLRAADGRYRWIRDECRLVRDAAGVPQEVVGVWLDVTERVAAEERVASMQAQLAVQQKMATVGQITATVSHELRNPLSTIRTSVFSLKERLAAGDPAHMRTLERIERNVLRCDNIINDLLDFSRTRDADPEPTEIGPWLRELVAEQQRPDWIRLDDETTLPGVVVVLDQDRLRRAVINVVENAVQAMQQDHNGAEPPDGRLRVRCAVTDGRLEIRVRDTGPGMEPAVLGRIFEPLYSTKTYGVGLGLPTVKQIMEQEGGGVEIQSSPGAGTEVLLWLPVKDRIQGVG